MGNVVPPGAQEGVITPSNFLCKNVDAFVVEGCVVTLINNVYLRILKKLTRKTTEKRIQDTTKSPHVDALTISFVFDDFGSSVSDGTAWGHGLLIPYNL